MLQQLPPELLHAVILNLETGDRRSLCLTSKYLYYITTPALFQSIYIHLRRDITHLLDVDGLLSASKSTAGNLLHYARDIHVGGPFAHRVDTGRCLHHEAPPSSDDEDREDVNEIKEIFQDAVPDQLEPMNQFRWMSRCDEIEMGRGCVRQKDRCLAVLLRCKEGAIRSFSWRLRGCVPDTILGERGYLVQKQQELEALHLVTDRECGHLDYSYHLGGFPKLHTLSWTGINTALGDLYECMERRSTQLKSLELNFLAWIHATVIAGALDDEYPEYFANEILPFREGEDRLLFPVIEDLSLICFSFCSAERAVAHAFNFESLRSLTLRFCPGWKGLVPEVVSVTPVMHLNSLVIQSAFESYHRSDEAPPIAALLDVITGLEELVISTVAPSETLDIWRAMARHKTTLRRFVHHLRTADVFQNRSDIHDLAIAPEHIPLLEDGTQNPLAGFDFRCVGICADPKYLKAIMSPLASKESLKILHIRGSGPNLKLYNSGWTKRPTGVVPDGDISHDDGDIKGQEHAAERHPVMSDAFHSFAQWAFGPEGFPSLRLLLYGDFSYGGRYGEYNVLLCRDSGSPRHIGGDERNYRHLSMVGSPRNMLHDETYLSDQTLRDMLHQYADILQACPVDGIVEEL